MRPIIFFFFLVALEVYVFQAFRTISKSWQPGLKYSFYIFYGLLALLVLGYFISGMIWPEHLWSKTLSTYWRALTFITVISMILAVPFLAIDDIWRTGAWLTRRWGNADQVFFPGRKKFLSQAAIALASVPFFTLTYGILRNAYRYKLYRQTIRIPGLPDALAGLRIVQISDIHSGSFTRKDLVKKAIHLINEQEADIVLFTGDLVNDRSIEMEPFMDVFDQIQSKHGVFSVLGNHDYGDYAHWENEGAKIQNLEQMKKIHQDLGWKLLLNENRILEINNEKVALIGVENYSFHPRFPKYGDLQKAYSGTQEASLRVLLSHDPSHWMGEVVKQFKDIHCTFSGHTHGFQFGVEIPGFIKWSPVQYVYKEWAGLYQLENQYLYVNRGLGFLGYPGRVGILPEIAVIDFEKA